MKTCDLQLELKKIQKQEKNDNMPCHNSNTVVVVVVVVVVIIIIIIQGH